MRFDPQQPLGDDFQAAVQSSLDRFFDTQRDLLAATGDRLALIWDQARHFAQGGKRLRPAFCYWGYVAAAATADAPPVTIIDIAASLDLLHLSALVHDDLIDASDTRRGGPAAHRFFEARHRAQGWSGDSERFGRSAAILFGDLLFAWSESIIDATGIPADRMKRARPYLDAMRSEVLAGQCLDLIHQAKPSGRVDMLRDAGLVMEFKTAKYTVSRPVQIGAALGLADESVLQGLGRFGVHVGRAFQMRDDLLGVFGDPAVTGKPAGDDLREGKKTALIGYAMAGASESDAAALSRMLGDPDLGTAKIEQARRILIESGAVEATEKAIVNEAAAGVSYLNRLDLNPDGAYALMALAHACVERAA